jgi:hypothetical protein
MSYNWELPFARLFGARRITSGWHLAGITRFADGTPISLQGNSDAALTNVGLDYPTQIGPIHKSNPRLYGNQYFNPSAFASGLSCGYEVCGVTGSSPQYSFSGPGTINTDASLEKDTKLTERLSINFRLEMFNVFNHANFLSSGVIGNPASGQFGQATTVAGAPFGRIGQISGKIIF